MTMRKRLLTLMRRTRHRRPIIISIGLILWCLVVIPVLNYYIREGSKHGAYKQYSTIKNGKDIVAISFDLLNMDPVSRKADLLVQVDPQGSYRSDDGLLKTNLTLNLRFKQLKWLEGSGTEPFTLSVPFIDGTLRDYPFDKFVAAFPVVIFNRGTRVPLNITTDAISQLFHFRYTIAPAYTQVDKDLYQQYPKGPQTDTIILEVSRPPTTFAICIFMAMLMWALAIALANVAWDAVIYHRDIPTPLLSIGVAMLFALPALRNSQPGVPAMGCYLDMCGFFWSMVIIAISSSTLIFHWVLAWKPAALTRT